MTDDDGLHFAIGGERPEGSWHARLHRGVGAYPCLLGGDPKQLLENPMSLKQLSSPPVAAKELATWFLGRQGPSPAEVGFHNPNAPLATVEMLLSPSQSYTLPGGDEVTVEAATRANIANCFKGWSEHTAAHDENVAVFYFCGHGLTGANDYLLPSDFGAVNLLNPWADAIDITETARAMRRLAGGSLYFFIDACRQAGRDALSPGATPPALAYVDFSKPVRGFARLILWATGEGEAAFGAAGKVSRFCAALTEALSGYEGEAVAGGTGWIVTVEMLACSVRRILEAANASLEPKKRQHVEQQLIGSQPFHFETAPPRQIAVGISSSWSVGPEVRQLLTGWGVGDALPDKVLEVLAEQLEAKNLEVEALQKETKNWTERYHELEEQLRREPDSDLAQQAQEFLAAGKLEEAGAALDRLIEATEARIATEQDRLACQYLSRARVFELQFRPLEALPFYEKACSLRPSDPQYALPYARLLLEQRDYRRAEPVCAAALGRLRELVVSEPDSYQGQLMMALQNLGKLHRAEHRYAEARQVHEEALEIYHALAEANRAAYRPGLAITLNDLGNLHADEHRYAEARQAYEEGVDIYRALAEANPASYRPDMAATLDNLGLLHADEYRYAEAREAHEEALDIYRALAEANPAAYRPDAAMTLNNLGNLHRAEYRYAEARQAYEEALDIYHALAEANPAAYRPDVAITLNNLGALHADEHRYAEARQAYEEALEIRRALAEANPAAYRPNVATTLYNLGTLHADEQRYAEARQAYEEALEIRRAMAEAHPAAYRPDVVRTLDNLGAVHAAEQRYAEARQAFEEALEIYRALAEANAASYWPDMAATLTNLGFLYAADNRYAEARQTYEEALRIYEELAAASPERFTADLEQVRDLIVQLPK